MHTVSNKILMAMIAASLAACGGGDSDSDSGVNQPGGSGNITGTPVEGSVKATNNAVFNLSGVVTLMEYDKVVDQETSSAQTLSLSGLTSTESSSSSDMFTTLGASNLLGINENGDTVFPVANVEPLMVDYSLLSPDQKKLYIAVSYSHSADMDYSNLLSRIDLKNTDGSYTGRQPLIGPALESSAPLTDEKFRELYPDGSWEMEYGTQNSDGSCETGVKSEFNSQCITAVLLDPSPTEDPIRIKIQDILNTLQEDYFSCSLVEVDRQGGPMDCVGGTTVADATVGIFHESFPFKLKTAKFNRGDSYYGGNLGSFEGIRPGLRPLQFDDAGNLYTLTSRFDSNFGYYSGTELTKITPAGELEQVIGLDSINVETFLALSNGEIITSVSNYNNTTDSGGIYLIQKGSMIKVSGQRHFQADTGSTVIISGKLFKSLPNGGGFTSIPIKYQGQTIFDTYLTDEGELFGCYKNANYNYEIVKVYPYQAEVVVPADPDTYGCDFSAISFGYRVAIKTVDIGSLGTTEIISALRLAGGKVFTVFEEEDYSDKPRYNISNLAFGGNTIIFSADRTTAPIGTVLGKIDVGLMGQGKTVEEYLELNEVQSSVAASNTVRKVTPLPAVIESGTTAAAPRISRKYFNKLENSHVGFEFAEFMDKDTVLESLSLTNTTNNSSDVDYIPFWGYKKLYLIADTKGFSDGVADDTDYGPYRANETYRFYFNPHIAKDVAGRTMSTSDYPDFDNSYTF